MKLPDLITSIVALYAAVLSTITLYVHIRSRRWHLAVHNSEGVEGGKCVFTVRAVNLGERPIALEHFSIRMIRSKRRLLSRIINALNIYRRLFGARIKRSAIFSESFVLRYDPSFPIDLKPGKSCEVVLNAETVVRSLEELESKLIVKIAGVFTDQTGKTYVSRPFAVDYKTRTVNLF